MVDTYPDLFWSYTVVWVLLTAYIVVLGFRMYRVEQRLRNKQKEWRFRCPSSIARTSKMLRMRSSM